MRVAFRPPEKPRGIVAAPFFCLLIVAGWLLPLMLTGGAASGVGIGTVDLAPFRHIEQGAYTQATPSLLYSLFVAVCYRVGAGIANPATGVLVFALVQLLICACACAHACSWLYKKGASLALALILAVGCAALAPLAQAIVQPHPRALVSVCLLLLTLGLIDAVADNCGRLRRAGPRCVLLTLLAALPFLDLTMLAVAVPTLVALALTPSRIKGRLALFALAMLAPSLAVLLFAFPYLGWSGDPIAFLRQSVSFGIDPSYLPLLVVTAIALAGVLLNRRPRYLLPFVPLLAFGALAPLFTPPAAWGHGLLYSTGALCLPFLVLIPAIREYRETKDVLRRRILDARQAIAEEERGARTETACTALLAELTGQVEPDDGYIGLYEARAGEMPCDPLAVQLGALGYRIAYPVSVSPTEIDFFTTIGVSDEALFNSLLEGNPFEAVGGMWGVGALVSVDPGSTGSAGPPGSLGGLGSTHADGHANGAVPEGLACVEPSSMAALVVPGIAFDRDRYRLGQGRGSYDRYILRLEAQVPVWGMGFREQLIDVLPIDGHDEPLDGVVVA
jgi:5-formyltetrahydrofolate cyclo-ligase